MQVYMGGIAPTSLASLKKNTCLAIYLAGCDFKCPYCQTAEFLDFKSEYLIDILDAKRQINAEIHKYDAILFSGGEPTLQRQALLNLARHCKDNGVKVGISTNGAKPGTIVMLMRENILDFIEVDLKSSFDEKSFEKITCSKNFFKPTNAIISEIKETLEILKKNENKIEIYFKTTIVPGLIDRKEDLFEIGKMIKDMKCTWIIQAVNTAKTLDRNLSKHQITIEELRHIKQMLSKEFKGMNIEVSE